MRQFVTGMRQPLQANFAHNLSPNYHFQYQNDSAHSRKNMDSAKYTNMTLHFII